MHSPKGNEAPDKKHTKKDQELRKLLDHGGRENAKEDFFTLLKRSVKPKK